MIVVGEALIDLVIDVDGGVTAVLGGAPFNAARAAARLGADVQFVGSLSTDRFGRRLRDQLHSDGVRLDHAPVTDAPTTLAAAEVDTAGSATYRFYVQGTSAPALRTEHLADLPADPTTCFTGGLALVLEPMATTVVALVERLPASTTVVVDLNCRPQVITDRPAWAAHLDRLLDRADLVKVSDEDLRYLEPDGAVPDVAAHLVDRGARAVLVTTGGSEATVVTATGTSTVPLPPAPGPVVDTIGAGDTFVGGLLAWLVEAGVEATDLTADGVLRDAVLAGHAAAAVVVTRRGADPPWRADLAAPWADPRT